MPNPSNYRGITLLVPSIVRKSLIASPFFNQSSFGGFCNGVSLLHTAFVFQEAVASIREKQKAFLDVQKAFDTGWHAGLMVI